MDKKLNFSVKNKKYGFLQIVRNDKQVNKLVYVDGSDLNYGDPAEIIPVVAGSDFISFIKAVINNTEFSREHYWFSFGYQPSDFDNEEIKANEVRIHYAGVDNTILKNDFYEMCILLCDFKLKYPSKDLKVSYQDIHNMKLQLEKKLITT